jgi:hypothetical protein
MIINHDLGVTTQSTYAVKRIYSDFFGEECAAMIKVPFSISNDQWPIPGNWSLIIGH